MTPTQKIDSLYFMIKQTLQNNISMQADSEAKAMFGRKAQQHNLSIVGIEKTTNILVEKILLMMYNNGKHGSYQEEPECTWEQYKSYWDACMIINKAHLK